MNAFNAEAGASEFGRRNVREARDARILIGVVVIHLDAAADLHLELAVAAREFRRALPFDLEVEIAAFGAVGSRLSRGGLRLGVLHLLLQGLDSGLHLIDLRLNFLHILRFGLWSPNGQKCR